MLLWPPPPHLSHYWSPPESINILSIFKYLLITSQIQYSYFSQIYLYFIRTMSCKYYQASKCVLFFVVSFFMFLPVLGWYQAAPLVALAMSFDHIDYPSALTQILSLNLMSFPSLHLSASSSSSSSFLLSSCGIWTYSCYVHLEKQFSSSVLLQHVCTIQLTP